jgi:hypothetical protein
VKHSFANDDDPCGSEPARDWALQDTIIFIDIHHRDDCLPLKNRLAQDQPIQRRNPTSEGKTMLIHLLTCLALTAVTLTAFSYIVLAEERTS